MEAEHSEDKPPLDKKLLNKVGRAMWRLESAEEIEGKSLEERDEIWQTAKDPFIKQARKLVRALESNGVVMALK